MIFVCIQLRAKFLMCLSLMILSVLLISFAPTQTTIIPSLFRLLISLSANSVASGLAPGINVSETSEVIPK